MKKRITVDVVTDEEFALMSEEEKERVTCSDIIKRSLKDATLSELRFVSSFLTIKYRKGNV